MNKEKTSKSSLWMRRFFADYGIIFVLLLLCGYYSLATLKEQSPQGLDAAGPMVKTALSQFGKSANFAIITTKGKDDMAFGQAVEKQMKAKGASKVVLFQGTPPSVKKDLIKYGEAGAVDVIIGSQDSANWKYLSKMGEENASYSAVTIIKPEPYNYPDFLKKSNLLAIADRIVVIAVIAIGMTMVIITTGIELSVGSMIALSAVVWTLMIRKYGGGEDAGVMAMVFFAMVAMVMSGLSGCFSGFMVTKFMIPPFIVTLAMMMVARGFAFIFADGQSIYQVPDSITWLGRSMGLFGIPNTVWLLIILYAAAHILMTRTVLGRYIYAVGGNKEAARLSGVPVNKVLMFVYILCGLLSGFGGIILASQLKSGAPTYGVGYEMYVIAAVVVGGTSLAGGEGKILGTLIGSFIIAVIQNGMNLTGVESYTQMVVLGLVILGAVLLDMLKKQGWKMSSVLKMLQGDKATNQ